MPLDISQPKSRLEEIVSTTQLMTALCSSARAKQLQDIVPGAVLPLNTESMRLMLDPERSSQKSGKLSSPTTSQDVTPHDICYILFTSGSTGRPKGVVLEHASVLTSLLGHASSMKVDPSSRVLQFAAYTFDTCIGEIFTALLIGATLCVPSEAQRMNTLTDFILERSVNWLWLTPTVASFLDPRAVSGQVKTMILGGEAASTRLFQNWIIGNGGGTSLVYGYGPTETSITVSFNESITVDTDPANIGVPICASTWVVDPHDSSRLLPIGCIGELVVSGPTVGRGYLDERDTARVFGRIPGSWERLVRPGREINEPLERERFYRTGDLVRYDTLGNIFFVGRKDDQVKLYGQRIELSEITNLIDEILGDRCCSVVEKIEISKPDPTAGTSESLLVAMFTVPDLEGENKTHNSEDEGLFHRPSPATTHIINDVETKLEAALPLYMIPKIFIPLRFVPVTITGKVDRNRLRREVLLAIQNSGRESFMADRDRRREQPRNDMEKKLQRIWSSILRVSIDRIGVCDSFLRLGGDSLKAIAVARAARGAGLHLSVADIFQYPILADMAEFVESNAAGFEYQAGGGNEAGGEESRVKTFSMVVEDVEDIKRHAADQCAIAVNDVEDIYPCTAMQVGMFVASCLVGNSDDGTANLYVLRRKIVFESSSAAVHFSAAWEAVTRRTPISTLR